MNSVRPVAFQGEFIVAGHVSPRKAAQINQVLDTPREDGTLREQFERVPNVDVVYSSNIMDTIKLYEANKPNDTHPLIPKGVRSVEDFLLSTLRRAKKLAGIEE